MPSTCPKPASRADAADLAEVRLPKDGARRRTLASRVARSGDGRLVGVNTKQAAARSGGLQDPESVPSATERRIDLEAARNR